MPQAAITPWLPPIPGLHRRDPEHRYWLGSVSFPVSVTGVLSAQKSPYAMARIEEARAVWEPRGNQTHRALELFLGLERNGNDGADVWELQELAAGDHADWIRPLITHPRWDQVQVIASERPTCCLSRRVAGTFDCAYVDDTLPTPERPSWASGGPPRVLADLKTLGAAVVKWRHVSAQEWTELAEVPADTAAARLDGGRVEIRAAHSSCWSFLMAATGAMATAGDSIELKVSKPSTYCTRAQLGGYQALEASECHGPNRVWYDYGQTIWARPGKTVFSPLYSRAECLLAWAGAWAIWRALHPGGRAGISL